eukprot:gnl/Spiro4/6327_TR3257_c1_g1_i1.p1 gnl/Spiro4/6327_TR3257_c1_g1~~gnl/Spiro4/6327_TR3257_c1_g1_i1.p1  ORF type:complete len:465 (-),score=91.73 gnl/Spiro4/6327_TR3257_c1_g1_i1:188-1582(-)
MGQCASKSDAKKKKSKTNKKPKRRRRKDSDSSSDEEDRKAKIEDKKAKQASKSSVPPPPGARPKNELALKCVPPARRPSSHPFFDNEDPHADDYQAYDPRMRVASQGRASSASSLALGSPLAGAGALGLMLALGGGGLSVGVVHSQHQSIDQFVAPFGHQRKVLFSSTLTESTTPAGVRETQHTIKDARTGVEKHTVSRALGGQSRTITTERNHYTGREQFRDHLENLEEEDVNAFNDRWKRAASATGLNGGGPLRLTGAPIGRAAPVQRAQSVPRLTQQPHNFRGRGDDDDDDDDSDHNRRGGGTGRSGRYDDDDDDDDDESDDGDRPKAPAERPVSAPATQAPKAPFRGGAPTRFDCHEESPSKVPVNRAKGSEPPPRMLAVPPAASAAPGGMAFTRQTQSARPASGGTRGGGGGGGGDDGGASAYTYQLRHAGAFADTSGSAAPRVKPPVLGARRPSSQVR